MGANDSTVSKTDSLIEYRKLGEILVARHDIDSACVAKALDEQKLTGQPLGRILLDGGHITEEQLAEAVAWQKHLPVVDLNSVAVEAEACQLVSYEMAKREGVLPISVSGDTLTVATANPLNISILDDLRVVTGMKIRPVVVTNTALQEAIGANLKKRDRLEELAREAQSDADENDSGETASISEDAPLVRLVNQLIVSALDAGASDIHIEPREHDVRLRYRVDGVLRTERTFSRAVLPGITTRIKVMSSLNIAERRLPQDGRCRTEIDGHKVDLRVSTLPSTFGESINMRVVNVDARAFSLAELGMATSTIEEFRRQISHSHGCLLVTGPTGSGKTTTLYSALTMLNEATRKIITVEDPVERSLEGVTQIQIADKVGLSFAKGLRSILRHDPDVVMVGEIRDLDTAEIAVRAALTGHFVLSTLHTNDASSALTRLVDMGVEPFLVASSVRAVLAQRLARKLCPHCREAYELDAKEFEERALVRTGKKVVRFYRPVGCKECGESGYRGRVGIFEFMIVDDDIGKLCLKRAASTEVRRAAIQKGMVSLKNDGLRKALEGLTSIEEVMRVLA